MGATSNASVGVLISEKTKTDCMLPSNFYLEDCYDDRGAMLYIVVMICVFAIMIVLLIAAQMSYRPEEENQVNLYLKHRCILRDIKMMQHRMKIRYLKQQRRGLVSRTHSTDLLLYRFISSYRAFVFLSTVLGDRAARVKPSDRTIMFLLAYIVGKYIKSNLCYDIHIVAPLQVRN